MLNLKRSCLETCVSCKAIISYLLLCMWPNNSAKVVLRELIFQVSIFSLVDSLLTSEFLLVIMLLIDSY